MDFLQGSLNLIFRDRERRGWIGKRQFLRRGFTHLKGLTMMEDAVEEDIAGGGGGGESGGKLWWNFSGLGEEQLDPGDPTLTTAL